MEKVLQQPRLNEDAVRLAYKAWAPVYDYSFGVVAGPGRRFAVQKLNEFDGHVLEVGVGTGLSLPRYKPGLEVTGIDLSPDMLAKAAERVEKLGLKGVTLSVMDAGNLAFDDESFDAAARKPSQSPGLRPPVSVSARSCRQIARPISRLWRSCGYRR